MTLSIDDLFRMPSEAEIDARARAAVALAGPFRLDAWSPEIAAALRLYRPLTPAARQAKPFRISADLLREMAP